MPSPTITAEQLCSMTGYTDRRLRQIAKEGFFPPPIRGVYAISAIQGIIRYLQAQNAKKTDKLSVEREHYMRARREKAEIETAIMRGDYAKSEEVCATLRNISLRQKAMLQMRLENELPPKLAGLTPVQIAEVMRKTVDEVCAVMRREVDKWI